MERTLIETSPSKSWLSGVVTEQYGISLVSRPVWVGSLQDLGF
jgi:hypothetical protein